MNTEYVDMMSTMLDFGIVALNLDARNLQSYPPTLRLWHQLQMFPNEIIPIMDQGLKDEMIDLADRKMNEMRMQVHRLRNESQSDSGALSNVPDLVRDVETRVYKVRPFGLNQSTNLRDLNPSDIDKLVSVKGMVIRSTPVIPDIKDAFYKCAFCSHTVRVDIDRGKILEPVACPRPACKTPNSMSLVHNRSGFADKQLIKLQETPDNVPAGQTPHSVSICVYDELVDTCKAGDRVEITGIFKSNPVRVNPNERSVKNIFRTYVDGLHVFKCDKRRLDTDPSTLEEEMADETAQNAESGRKISEEDVNRIKETSQRPDLYSLLSRSLAPSIYEMDDVKKGILLQLFGGTNKSFEKGGSPRYRGDINILLCGDPSTSKSQILQYVHKIAPRGIYTSGKGSSAVGLTAYITRDPDTRQLVLESGALVLSDGGVCCIDEFDKMSDSARSVLHEVMEQQTVSVAKAGIITTLNARASILASANPIGSRYNPNLSVPANIDLPPTLLSRFDLVYLVLDRVDEQADRRLARHMVSMYLEDTPEHMSRDEILPTDFLTAYISYARQVCFPHISRPAALRLSEAYVAMRAMGADDRSDHRRITATTRQLESMIRLSEAHAKMRLSDTVEVSDVDEAVRLIRSAMKQSATDARTGLIDMGLLSEEGSSLDRYHREKIRDKAIAVLDEMQASGGGTRYSDFTRVLAETLSADGTVYPPDSPELLEVLKSLETSGVIKVTGDGNRRTVRKLNA